MPRHSDITVAGAGIVGASTALALQRCGHRVTLIDKWGAGNSRASSTDYNRVIRAIYGRDVFYTRLAREARELWLELQTETGQQLYYECGALVLATAGQCQWEGNTCETFKQLGVPHHRFSKEEVAMRFPQFKVDDIAYGIYEPEAGMLMAHRAVITTVNLFKRLGGLVKTGEVTTDGAERPLLTAGRSSPMSLLSQRGLGWPTYFRAQSSLLAGLSESTCSTPRHRQAWTGSTTRTCRAGSIAARVALACQAWRDTA